ncbi:MAG: YggS family pyridoxal phosphate-dependent enzyme [Candidatus Nanopelagicales bacterium]
MADRQQALARNLQAVRQRIAHAAESASRDPASVTLVVVTKTWPASDIRLLAQLGVQHVGENRDQEAAPKAAQLTDLALEWHFIGQLQTNKVRSVATYATVVESVDRTRLVRTLDQAALSQNRRLRCLIQVQLDSTPGRGGATPTKVPELAQQLADSQLLEVAGVMGVAPLGEDPLVAFGRLADVASELRRDHPEAVIISAGMSGDLEAAIACGATHVRVGSAVLGHRPPVG